MRRNAHSPVRDRRDCGSLLHRRNRVGLTEHRHVAIAALPLVGAAQQTGRFTGQLDTGLLTKAEAAHHGVALIIAHRLTDEYRSRVRGLRQHTRRRQGLTIVLVEVRDRATGIGQIQRVGNLEDTRRGDRPLVESRSHGHELAHRARLEGVLHSVHFLRLGVVGFR